MSSFNKTNEELVTRIRAGEIDLYQELFRNLKPIMIHEIEIYRNRMAIYDFDDLIQEAEILIWNIVKAENFKSGFFAAYYKKALKNRLVNIYRDYTLKNLVYLGQYEYGHGNVTNILGVSDYAIKYREIHREQCRKYDAKKKAREAEARRLAGIPEPEPKKPLTEDEKKARYEHNKAVMREYYHKHKDEINRKRKEKRDAIKKMRAELAL